MDTILWLIGGGLVLAIGAAGAYSFLTLHPEVRREIALRQQARQDFQDARGAQHLLLLNQGLETLLVRQRRLAQELGRLQPVQPKAPDQQNAQERPALEQPATGASSPTSHKARLEHLQAEQARLGALRSQAEAEIARLSQVTEADLLAALTDPAGRPAEAIDHYLQGAYPEWQPAPGWFQELLALKER